MEALTIELACLSEAGSIRENNQDSVRIDPAQGVVVLADGVGGRAHGEVASAMAVDACMPVLGEIGFLAGGMGAGEFGRIHSFIREGVRECNRKIFAAGEADPELKGMAATLVAGLFVQGHLFYCHLGDSRIYGLRNGQLAQLTTDHTQFQEYFESTGILDRSIPENAITRALGAAETCQPDCADRPLRKGDIYLFCSDGITKDLSNEQVVEVLSHPTESLDALARRLLDAAIASGGSDNITVALARVAA